MDYYIVVNGQKQGPFDLIGLIKKIKNGLLTPETLVSDNAEGPFVMASEVSELMHLLTENAAAQTEQVQHREVKLSFKKVFSSGADLWSRHVVSFSLFVGITLITVFFIAKTLKSIIFMAQYPVIPNFIITFIASFIFIIFFYFVLLAKRSQRLDSQELLATIKAGVPATLLMALGISSVAFASIFGSLIGFLGWIVLSFVIGYFIFMPFIIFDDEKGLGAAARISVLRVARLGSHNLGVIMMLIMLNVVLTFLPAMLAKGLLGFGLFISLPVTVSALAFIYDDIFG